MKIPLIKTLKLWLAIVERMYSIFFHAFQVIRILILSESKNLEIAENIKKGTIRIPNCWVDVRQIDDYNKKSNENNEENNNNNNNAGNIFNNSNEILDYDLMILVKPEDNNENYEKLIDSISQFSSEIAEKKRCAAFYNIEDDNNNGKFEEKFKGIGFEIVSFPKDSICSSELLSKKNENENTIAQLFAAYVARLAQKVV